MKRIDRVLSPVFNVITMFVVIGAAVLLEAAARAVGLK